jgi:hypothetical protein
MSPNALRHSDTPSRALIQEADPGDFPSLLRLGYDRKSNQRHCYQQ